jgi:L-cystine uptake protein TcyP (sodium:dicarboxylate symporter family)
MEQTGLSVSGQRKKTGILAVFAAMLVVLKIMRSKGLSFTARVFTALGLGVLLGLGIQLLLGRDGDAATTALDWISIVGQGYIGLLKMLVMPLVFVAIVGAFTRAEVTEHFGRIAFAVLAVLLGTVTVAAVLGWGATVLTGLAHAGFLDAATPDAAELSSLASQQSEAASLTLPQEILSFIPTNPFADLAGARSTSTIAVVIFSAILGVAYIRLRDKDVDQADFFKSFIDSLYGIVMRIVAMVLGLTPYGILALIAKVMAASDYRAILGLGKFVLVSYGALLAVLCVHCLILLANRVNPATYFKKAFPVLSFAFVSRSSAGALPLNIETQHKALGVDSASANLAASFGMSIGQNGCAGVYPAMLATIVAPTVGIDVLSPTFFVPLIAVVAISSFGVAGVGGGATFASLIVLGTMGLPIEVVAVLASVEPLIDMGRTALNVSDSMVAGITASHVAGGLDRSVLDDPEARVTAEAHVS